MVKNAGFVFLCFAGTLCGCEGILHRSFFYPRYAPEYISHANVSASDLESKNEYKAQRNPHALIVEPDPQIARIMISENLASEANGETRTSYTLDDVEYNSLEAICDELKKRRPPINETGIWYAPLNSCSRSAWIEASEFMEDYCLRNDIDLFRGFERELYSGLPPGQFITWWTIRSSKTKYQSPENAKRKRKRVKRVSEPLSELVLKEIPSTQPD